MSDKEVLNQILLEIQGMKDVIQGMKDVVQGMKTELNCLNQRVTGIELHLENVTDKNIRTIAEGHLDLSRKLDEALKVENEKELLLIRVRILEDEIQKIKERPGQTA